MKSSAGSEHSVEALLSHTDSLTGAYLSGRRSIPLPIGHRAARSSSMRARCARAYSSDSSSATGTSVRSGSPTCAYRSAKASLTASTCRCTTSGSSGERPEKSSSARMWSACSIAMPWLLGGFWWTVTSSP